MYLQCSSNLLSLGQYLFLSVGIPYVYITCILKSDLIRLLHTMYQLLRDQFVE